MTIASVSDGLSFCGVIEEEHALVGQRFIKFLDRISLVGHASLM